MSLNYTETITWFSRIVHSSYLQKVDTQNNFTEIINKLHLILRPENNNRLCIALKHKKSFIKLSHDLLNAPDDMKRLDANIETIKNEEPEKYKFIESFLDRNILLYLSLFPIHIFVCLLLSKTESSSFNVITFIGNLTLYIPADILAILVYIGFIKEVKPGA